MSKFIHTILSLALLCTVLVQCWALGNFDFCNEETKLQKLYKYKQIVCSNVLSEDDPNVNKINEYKTGFNSPKYASLLIQRCCRFPSMCKDLEHWEYICHSNPERTLTTESSLSFFDNFFQFS